MNNNIKFGLQFELDGDQVVVRGLDNMRGEVRGVTDEVKRHDRAADDASRTNKQLAKSFTGISSAVKIAGGFIAALGVTKLAQDIYRVNAESQRLNASLVTVTGSQKAASAAWAELEKFASTTPFALDQSINAFVKMKALGLDPTTAALTSFGNTASAMGKDLNQMIEAVADASTGEFERLKEFGIKTRVEGDKVRFIFQGVTTEVKNNAEAITQYLENIGNTEFSGAMERQMDTLGGAMSNLGDNADALMRAIGRRGVNEGLADSINWVSELFANLTEQINGPTVESITAEIQRIEVALSRVDDDSRRRKRGRGPSRSALEERLASLREELLRLKALSGDKDSALAVIELINSRIDQLESRSASGQNKRAKNSRIAALKDDLVQFQAVLDSTPAKVDDVVEATAELTEEQRKALDERKKLTAAYEATVSNLQFEADLLQRELVATTAGKEALAAFNREKYIEVELRRANAKDLLPEEIKRLREEIAARYDAEKALSDYQDKLEAIKDEADPFADAWEEATKRIDEAFADAWQGAFDSFEDFADSIEDAFKRLLAELAHQAITKPILVQLALGGGGSGGNLASSLLGGGGSGGGGISLSNFSSLLNVGKGAWEGITGLASGKGFSGFKSVGGGLSALFGGNTAYGSAAHLSNAAFEASVLENGLGQTLGSGSGGAGGVSWGGAGWAALAVGIVNTFNDLKNGRYGISDVITGNNLNLKYGDKFGGFGQILFPSEKFTDPLGVNKAIFGGLNFGGDGKKRSNAGVNVGTQNKKHTSRTVTGATGLKFSAIAKRSGKAGRQAAEAMLDEFVAIDAVLESLYEDLIGVDVNLKGRSLAGKGSEAGHRTGSFFGSARYNGVKKEDLLNAPEQFVKAWVKEVNRLTGETFRIQPIINLQDQGESLAGTLVRVQAEFSAVNNVLELMGKSAIKFSESGLVVSDRLVEQFGGLESFAAATGIYVERFYSDREKFTLIQQQMMEAFEAIGFTLPKTRDEFRALVESANIYNAKGRETYANLVQLAPAFDEYLSAQQALAPAIAAVTAEVSSLTLAANDFASRQDYLRALYRQQNGYDITGLLSNIPQFASGGYHAGGYRIVGERGPELEFTGPSHIVSANDTAALFDNSGMESELRALRYEVAQLRSDNQRAQYQIAKYTQRFAKLADRWDVDGMPEVRSA